jgi:signal transduction histidine kinase
VRGEEVRSLRIALGDASEVRTLQAKLALASRLAAMGTLVAGVAHEINNPLAAQMAGQGLALEVAEEARNRIRSGRAITPEAELRELDQVIAALTDAQEGALRIAGIVKDMAAFTRPDPRRTRVRLRDVVAGALRWLPVSVSQAATIEVVDRESPDVLVAAGQIEQVVMNLVQNAVLATPQGSKGAVVVRTGTGSAGQATVEVADRGVGIPPTLLDRIFEPFFTTRPSGAGRGTGLGLAISHAIVTAHGGVLLVESRPGEGSTFRVELPAAPAAA